MSQPKLLKVSIVKNNFEVLSCEDYRQTEKLIRNIKFDRSWGNNSQIRIDEILKYMPGYSHAPSAGCVYCFESDLEAGKRVLVEAVNQRLIKELEKFQRLASEHNANVMNIPGAQKLTITSKFWEKP